ncbi:metallophosphoesterase [Georgenia muralis]
MPARPAPSALPALRLTAALAAGAVVAVAAAAPTTAAPGAAAPAVVAPATVAPTALATQPPPLVVTEIAPDTVSYDDYEFVELHNTTDADIDLTAAGVDLFYIFDGDDTARDVPLTYPAGTVVPAGGTVVLWLTYTSTTVTAPDRTEQEFRDHWAAAAGEAADYPLVRLTGQPGMANGGDRGIRVTTAETQTFSYYPAGSAAPDQTVHFRLPADGGAGLDVLATRATPSPGVVAPEALVPAEPEPTPEPTEQPTEQPTEEPTAEPTVDPTAEPTAEPTEQPTETPTEEPTATPGPLEPDPTLEAATLQVTELVPDTSNVDGADAYEFIELYNPTAEPVSYADFTLDYLYPLEDLTNSNVVTWPAQPADLVVDPGATIVLWVKNGRNDHLTDADFNAHYGSDLTAGDDLAEIFIGGMANGSARGMQVVTNTGFAVSTAYYNLAGADDTAANIGIHYAHDPADLGRQQLLRTAPATPGAVDADQVPAGLVVPAEDATAPAVTDTTAAEIDPAAGFPIDLTVTDDAQVRTVTVHVRSSADAGAQAFNLRSDGADGYTHVVDAADLTGKRWYEYWVTASDGTNVTTTDVRRVPVAGVDQSPVRLNVTDGEVVAGEHVVSAAGDTYPRELTLAVDGETVPTGPALESAPVFIFEAGGVDTYFRNGVKVGDETLRIFDDGIYEGFETIATPVPLEHVARGEDLVVSVWAGTKAAPEIDPDENNDDFQITNLRLVLPDGRTLRPAGYEDPAQVISMGDSAGKNDFVDAVFTLPEDAFRAVGHTWDTTAAADGEHTVSATDGTATAQASVVVDNTAPVIATDLADGDEVRGEVVLDAAVTDATGVETVTATFDGEPVTLPHTVSSVDLAAGEHTFAVEAADAVGNTATHEVRFTTPVEQPAVDAAESEVARNGDVELSATVTDPSGDPLDVSFREGHRLTPGDGVEAYVGQTREADGLDREGRQLLTGADLEALTGADGVEAVTTSADAFPYQLFEVAVPEGAGDDARVHVSWDGSANPGAKVLLYVLNTATGAWEEVDRHVTDGETAQADAREDFTLGGLVPAADHVADGNVTVLVQHSEGFAGEDLSTRASAVEPNHPEDTPRSAYDFTIGWESDTQYYNETFYDHQLAIHDFFLTERADLNLQYVIHTGDIVDVWDDMAQWDRADAAYTMLDDADLPYGVLAGNHDVGSKLADYSNYSEFFGAERYADNPWWGGDYADNRGHYDLVTAGGIDFLMLSMGWDPGAEEIAWLNEVLAQYPERVAILNLHEYMLTTGGLGPIPQQIYDEVVATNPNVKMVFSGHYHDAYTRIDDFDDDGDGAPDRSVYQVLFDYQGLPEGGLGYLRLLHFDNDGEQVVARTYSPSLDDYDADDASLAAEHQDFTIPYAAVGITPREKVLGTDALVVEVLTGTEIAGFEGVPSGETVTAGWAGLPAGEHGWYAVVTDPYGAEALSTVETVTVSRGGAGEPGAGKPPAHAGEQGRPAFAGEPGPPPHAGGYARRP